MRKYLLPENKNQYRANLHCHSVISDGQLTPEELKAAYKKQGYAILAISDHEKMVDHSDLNDPDFLTLTAAEYSIVNRNRSYPVPKTETNMKTSRYCSVYHFNIFAKDPHAKEMPAKDTIWGSQHGCFTGTPEEEEKKKVCSYDNVNEVIEKCNQAGFLVQYNHPNWSLNTREDYMALKGVWSLEILNYSTELETGGEYCPYIYDDMLREGENPNLYCSMGDDNHNPGRTTDYCFGGSTIILSDELTYDKVYSAMEKGEFYCTGGPRIYALYIEDNKLCVDCSPAESVIVTGYCRSFRNVLGDGLTHAEFPLNVNDVRVRVTIRDRAGRYANTNSYLLDGLLD